MPEKTAKTLSLTEEVSDRLEEEAWGEQSGLVEELLRDHYGMDEVDDA